MTYKPNKKSKKKKNKRKVTAITHNGNYGQKKKSDCKRKYALSIVLFKSYHVRCSPPTSVLYVCVKTTEPCRLILPTIKLIK